MEKEILKKIECCDICEREFNNGYSYIKNHCVVCNRVFCRSCKPRLYGLSDWTAFQNEVCKHCFETIPNVKEVIVAFKKKFIKFSQKERFELSLIIPENRKGELRK